MKIITELDEKGWVPFDDFEKEGGVPYWFRRPNGVILLAAWVHTSHCAGWAEVKLSPENNDKLSMVVSGSRFYMKLNECEIRPFIDYEDNKKLSEGNDNSNS